MGGDGSGVVGECSRWLCIHVMYTRVFHECMSAMYTCTATPGVLNFGLRECVRGPMVSRMRECMKWYCIFFPINVLQIPS